MHILILHQQFLNTSDGGGSRFNQFVEHWRHEHEITVLSGMIHYASGKKYPECVGKFFFEKDLYPNVKLVRCYTSDNYNSGFIGRLWAYFSYVLSSIFYGLFILKNRNVDVVLSTSPPLFIGISGYIISLIKRAKWVFEIRDLWPESAIETGVVKNQLLIKFSYWLEKFIYEKANLINTLTPSFYNIVNEQKNISKKKLLMIPNGADFSLKKKLSIGDVSALRKKLGWENKIVFIYVGAHGVANYLSQMVPVIEEIEKRKTRAHFCFIGAGPKKNELIDLSEASSLKTVQFIDPVSKEMVFNYISAADVGMSILKKTDVFKTIYSNKTFDYMTCSKPVLLLIDGVSRKLVEESECGIFAEPENTDEIVKAVERFIEMPPNETKRLGMNGHNFAIKNFDRTVLAEKYLNKIENLVSGKL